jgi:hypothetical protein
MQVSDELVIRHASYRDKRKYSKHVKPQWMTPSVALDNGGLSIVYFVPSEREGCIIDHL